MDKLKLILVKILLLTTLLAILSSSTADAKTTKSHLPKISKDLLHELKNHHKKIKRSAYTNWGRSGYAASLPPYLVYNRKLGSYYPYYKYPENNLRRNMRRLYKEYAANKKYNKYSTIPSHLYKH